MDIILKQDVDNLGFKDDIVTVKNGYGLNYLIPKGYAVLATQSQRKQLANSLKLKSISEKAAIDQAEKFAKAITKIKLSIAAKSSQAGKLFGSVSSSEISLALKREKIDIEKKYIKIAGDTIKSLGNYQAMLRFHREVIVPLEFQVVEEKSTKKESKK